MKKRIPTFICLSVALAALALAVLTRTNAIAESARTGDKTVFALSVITAVAAVVCAIVTLRDKPRKTDIRLLAMASVFAALCFVGCTYFKIPIPGSTSFFHLGNTFCVLGALFLGGFWGGMAGSVGMTISDLFTGHIDSAPRTFFLKLCIGLIAGMVAHRVFHISEGSEKRRVSLPVATAVSCGAGMLFNVFADPFVGYFYKMYVMGIPQNIASSLQKIATVATAVNAVIAVIAATIFYLALRPALTHAKLMPKL